MGTNLNRAQFDTQQKIATVDVMLRLEGWNIFEFTMTSPTGRAITVDLNGKYSRDKMSEELYEIVEDCFWAVDWYGIGFKRDVSYDVMKEMIAFSKEQN